VLFVAQAKELLTSAASGHIFDESRRSTVPPEFRFNRDVGISMRPTLAFPDYFLAPRDLGAMPNVPLSLRKPYFERVRDKVNAKSFNSWYVICARASSP